MSTCAATGPDAFIRTNMSLAARLRVALTLVVAGVGMFLSTAAVGWAQDEPLLPFSDPSILSIARDLVVTTGELARNNFQTEACAATIELTKSGWTGGLDTNDMGPQISFMQDHAICCSSGQRFLPQIISFSGMAGQFDGMKGGDVAELALQVFLGEALKDNTSIEMLTAALSKSWEVANACRAVAVAHRNLD